MASTPNWMTGSWVQEYTEFVNDFAARVVPVETVVDTDEEDDDARLSRLGINTTPRPQPVQDEGQVLAFHGDTTAWATVHTTINDATINDSVAVDLAVNGSMIYNGEELENVIRRIVREEIQNISRREEQ